MGDIGDKLERLRRPHESKKAFAERLGISPVQLSRYLRGAPPGRQVLTRIADVTGASLDWLLGGNDDLTGKGRPVRRLAARTSRRLTDAELVTMACSYLDELTGLSREEREALKEIVRDLPAHRDRLAAISTYLRFLRLEAGRER